MVQPHALDPINLVQAPAVPRHGCGTHSRLLQLSEPVSSPWRCVQWHTLPKRSLVRVFDQIRMSAAQHAAWHSKCLMNVGGLIFWGPLLGQHLVMLSALRPQAKENRRWIHGCLSAAALGGALAWPHPPGPRHMPMHARPRAGNRQQVVGSISPGRAYSPFIHTPQLRWECFRAAPGVGVGVGGAVMHGMGPLSAQSLQSLGGAGPGSSSWGVMKAVTAEVQHHEGGPSPRWTARGGLLGKGDGQAEPQTMLPSRPCKGQGHARAHVNMPVCMRVRIISGRGTSVCRGLEAWRVGLREGECGVRGLNWG